MRRRPAHSERSRSRTISRSTQKHTKAKLFSEIGKQTEVLGRFSTAAGISFSPCKMLQARLFAYADAHRYRLGANFERLPVNAPKGTKAHNYQRDGHMRFDGNSGASPNYEPNTFGGPKANLAHREPPLKISGDADRYEQKRVADDDHIQPGNLYRLLPEDEQERLIENIVGSLKNVPEEIQGKMVGHFRRADADYGEGIAKSLGLS